MTETMYRTLYRTLCYCIIIIGGVYFSSYITALEKRVITLEERVEHGLVIPLPLDLNRFRFRLIEGDNSK